MSAWLLPDHFADLLPAQAGHIERMRTAMLGVARTYGYELVIPPLLEHLESLQTASHGELDLQTFKLVDQLSGRTLGLRADTTPQVARIDAHLLGRPGVSRLCYCGPTVHTRPQSPQSSREPLQLGAEIYGEAALDADVEILHLACDCLHSAGIGDIGIDLAHARIVTAVLEDVPPRDAQRLHEALAAKDRSAILQLGAGLPASTLDDLLVLIGLYGDESVLAQARQSLHPRPAVERALGDLERLAGRVRGVRLTFDLADMRGYDYYTGPCFALYAPRTSEALVRGGRYDDIGAAFGRNRPAAGFSVDLKALLPLLPPPLPARAILAPWDADPDLEWVIATLRGKGETVIRTQPMQDMHGEHATPVVQPVFHCDRALVRRAGAWCLADIDPSHTPPHPHSAGSA
ncbi:ATP phosphoribosyltransferase regulatory subunit [Candidatus Symbiobacter mobilis]|uniref:ATP phosphoribosyltransferase regulatory subunit n=1 Tax=Candidatus Symbiobacter mobilis CR TaxID=946483 RepID=U5ND29_9BURK|nr:ATP phosphoribosyltransferase regulatory subunit [Candidatus Symbiobacter mobilis]AGX88074.1 ATP phosphoribosyltransferase regulatory subunit [Candidatus Symbiobacter mobilis CR]